MKHIEEILFSHNYSKEQGFFSPAAHSGNYPKTEADKVWSKLARANHIQAAAATNSKDPYAKYPKIVNEEIQNEEHLILDAGCGYGRVAIPLLKKNSKIKIVGIDASSVMLQNFLNLIENETQKLDLKERVFLIHSNINKLLFSDETFDCIYSCAVLLHNPYNDVKNIIKEFYRLLKPQGKLILQGSFLNLYNLEGVQNWLYLKFLNEEKVNGPVRIYTKNRVLKLFHDWSNIRLLPGGVTLFPRQIAKISLPFGNSIRRSNRWIERKNFKFISKTSLLVKCFDVVALK